MPHAVPATELLVTGECTPACLLAIDPIGPCECACRGRHHAALAGVTVDIDGPPRPRPATRPLLEDVLAVLGAAARMHNRTLLGLLADQWPDPYRRWTVDQLGRALRRDGVRTRQLWQLLPDGRGINRRGILRRDVFAALTGPTS